MEYCLTVVVLLLVHGISGQLTDCDLRDDNDEPLKFDDWEVHSFGEILKTVADGTDLTGIQMTGVKFYSTDINECSDFLTVTTTDTHITITTKNFANWDRDGNLNGLCTLMFKFDPSNCDNMETTSVKLLVSYTIKDVNLMIPKFNEGSYTLNVSKNNLNKIQLFFKCVIGAVSRATRIEPNGGTESIDRNHR